ncbi:hypothetical protein M942_04570 [Enterobacter ludwigii]|jgi:hypothetical protein|uniref:hypothetical protein n=1 Tax=Enterobacter TaxID=547 RepID=UPI0003D7FB6C|nr:hypothetical protein [Enterobacter ludwigii]AHE72563.1 hypothetical protein M942_04570 [Enterobacter ludwigii]
MRSFFPALLLALVVVGCAALPAHPLRTTVRLATDPDFVRLLTLARHADTVNGWLQFTEALHHEH